MYVDLHYFHPLNYSSGGDDLSGLCLVLSRGGYFHNLV